MFYNLLWFVLMVFNPITTLLKYIWIYLISSQKILFLTLQQNKDSVFENKLARLNQITAF